MFGKHPLKYTLYQLWFRCTFVPAIVHITTTVTFMSKEEFEELQSDLQKSGKPLMSYLHDAGINYSTYTYWRRKLERDSKPQPEIAPISFRSSADSVFTGSVPSGATLLFPNGLRAHFGSGTEDVLRELLDKSLVSHVLP